MREIKREEEDWCEGTRSCSNGASNSGRRGSQEEGTGERGQWIIAPHVRGSNTDTLQTKTHSFSLPHKIFYSQNFYMIR